MVGFDVQATHTLSIAGAGEIAQQRGKKTKEHKNGTRMNTDQTDSHGSDPW
jgi:hypothetical protein